jgi:hypothetical protein
MAVLVEMQHAGDPASQREVAAVIEHMLADRPGDWRVSIVGSQANDRWEMKIVGPNAFERSYNSQFKAMRSTIGANVRNRPYETARIARFPLYGPVHPHAFPVVKPLAATHHTPGKMVLSEP